jgi:hypothetical protein
MTSKVKALFIGLSLSTVLISNVAQAAVWLPIPPWCREGQNPKKDNCRDGSDSGGVKLSSDTCPIKTDRGSNGECDKPYRGTGRRLMTNSDVPNFGAPETNRGSGKR